LLRDPHARVRAGLARALGYVGTREAIPAVLQGIEDGLLPPSVGMMTILRIYPRRAEDLEYGFRSEAAALRRVAAASAGILEIRDLREPLEELLTDADPGVRYAAIEAIGRLADPRSIEVLGQHPLLVRDQEEWALIEAALENCRVANEARQRMIDDFDEEGELA
jgi:HEAT repeat protein